MNPRSPSLRQRFREQARAELLDAAMRVFQRDGFNEARIDAIAAEAGVSVGTVYNVFGDRAGLVQAVMEHGRAAVFAEVRAYIEGSGERPYEERLRAVVHLLLGRMREHWTTLRMLIQADMGPGCPAAGHAHPPRHVVQEIHGMLQAFVQAGIDCGALAPADAHVATCALVGAIRTTVDVDLALGFDAPSEARVDALIQLFLDGAARRPSSP